MMSLHATAVGAPLLPTQKLAVVHHFAFQCRWVGCGSAGRQILTKISFAFK